MQNSSSDSSSSESGNGDDSIAFTLIKAANELKASLNERLIEETIFFDPKYTIYIRNLDPSICISDFRFRKNDLQELADRLWPKMALLLNVEKDAIICANGYSCPYESGLLMVLYRMSRPRRISPDMERFSHWRKSKISAVLQTFFASLYRVAMQYLSDPSIFQHRFQFYADLISKESNAGLDLKVWGFIDGTLRKTCRPTLFQKQMYSGHKRCHGIKFQSVVTPDGLVALLFGPIEGSRHDSHMLNESGLLDQLNNIMPVGPQHPPVYSLYGDPAYPQSLHLLGGFRNP